MSDQKLTQLSALTSPVKTDIVYIVSDPSSAQLSKKITLADLLGSSSGELPLGSSTFIYFGDSSTDGSWRIGIVVNDLSVQRRESSLWVEKGAFVA